MSTTREKALNRARVARHTQRRRERTIAIMDELYGYVEREKLKTDDGKLAGYAYRVRVPEDFYQRFEELAREHGRTAKELLDDTMAVYLDEVRRLKDEQN